MCCYIDESTTAKKIASLKRQNKKFLVGWKVLNAQGRALYNKYWYKPGLHKRVVKEYSRTYPRGFHFYIDEISAKNVAITPYDSRTVVRVKIPINSLIGIEKPTDLQQEGVASKLFITKSDWKEAGLPIKRRGSK